MTVVATGVHMRGDWTRGGAGPRPGPGAGPSDGPSAGPGTVEGDYEVVRPDDDEAAGDGQRGDGRGDGRGGSGWTRMPGPGGERRGR
jgi:hypothetical protein